MSYVIFSIDHWYELHTLAKFTRHVDTLRSMGKLEGQVFLLIGCYQDRPELSFICTEKDFNDHIRDSNFVNGQKSFLHVGDESKMPAWIKDWEGNTLDSGRLRVRNNVVALAEYGDWSYRPDLNIFYVMD